MHLSAHRARAARLTPLALAATAAAALSLSSCSGSWDEEAAAPENFRATYQKLHDCRASAHPAAAYVITWLSPDGAAAWDKIKAGMGADAVFPEGAVALKAQYEDSSCSTLSGYTLMEKLAEGADAPNGDWRWQFLDEDGACNDCALGSSCSSCHTLPTCVGHFCTQP